MPLGWRSIWSVLARSQQKQQCIRFGCTTTEMQIEQSPLVLLFACVSLFAYHAFLKVKLVAEATHVMKAIEGYGTGRLISLENLYKADGGFLQDKKFTLGVHLSVIAAVGCLYDE